MTFVTYPLDDIDYSAEDAELFHCTRNSGIYAGEDFAPSVTGADNIVTIGAGVGWIRNSRFKGKVIAMKEDAQIDVGLPDASYPRYDVIAIRFTANGNATELVVKNGKPASDPEIPAITRTEAVYELYLCGILREVGATAVSEKDVTDLRLHPDYCGLMADSITKIDTKAIEAQISGLIAQLRSEITSVKDGTAYVMKSGDTMTGNIAMGGNKVTGIGNPTDNEDAANKQYVDGKHKLFTATLTASGWSSSAPYTQALTVSGILASDTPHVSPVYSTTLATALAQKEAWAMVDRGVPAANKITFTCFEDKPATNIPIQIEVNR